MKGMMKLKPTLILAALAAVVCTALLGCDRMNYTLIGTRGDDSDLVNINGTNGVVVLSGPVWITNYWGRHGWTTNAP
jgi:hypothetical protein